MFAAAAIAAAAVVSVWAAEPEFSAERMKAHVTFLADDLLEGREAGTRGYEVAARYIASQFALLGVKPAGEDGGATSRRSAWLKPHSRGLNRQSPSPRPAAHKN